MAGGERGEIGDDELEIASARERHQPRAGAELRHPLLDAIGQGAVPDRCIVDMEGDPFATGTQRAGRPPRRHLGGG
jgi:hypothetical protein